MDRDRHGESAPHRAGDTRLLEEEIRLFEWRLARLGLDGDCAYERALSRAYGSLLEERRSRLAAMRAAGF
ncbi:hypothetical protein [Thiohalobacter sp.]|uniref:hypothetical protein n=1 Tax=Thiohalobacter sp. TaxID=2025948 RepID=UPI00260A2FF9|nr:hypothetical protein [Thiohalobacter sp.]